MPQVMEDPMDDTHRHLGFLLPLRLLTAAGLAIDAYVHFDLAAQYDANAGGISQGVLFRAQASIAVLMALAVLASTNRAVHLVALLVAISALGAVVLYRYVDVGMLGPLPDMYDPAWYPEKTVSAVAEAIATLGAVAFLIAPRRTGTTVTQAAHEAPTADGHA
jgi:hypothetical protein